MFTGWIRSERRTEGHQRLVQVSDWYKEATGLQVVGEGKDFGSVALGSKEHGPAIILLPGESIGHPEKLQMHFPVPDVRAEYNRLRKRGIQFDEPPEDKPWGWRHAYTRDPAGHTVELCAPIAGAKFSSCELSRRPSGSLRVSSIRRYGTISNVIGENCC
jgi:catechol 2,3-dioxygenase-like lactoylglutathione lyase family enzyme